MTSFHKFSHCSSQQSTFFRFVKKMSPWKNGFWYCEDLATQFFCIDGEKVVRKNFIALDYPDSKPKPTGPWKYGDFGPTNPKIEAITGEKHYSIEFTPFFGKTYGGIE